MHYLDYAATTPMHPEAFAAMTPWLQGGYGNASSVYALGREARKAVEEARAKIAAAIGAEKNEIYFTSGGTEADNWAIKGAARAKLRKGKHIITTAIEHHAVLHAAEALEKQGYDITYLPVDEMGLITAEQVAEAIRPDTVLVTVMMANNEIGTLQPIADIGAVCRQRGVWLHTDAVQAVGHVPVDVKAMKIDMLSLSGHKFGGPKGVGVLYLRAGVVLPPMLDGGAQERGRRAGTENVAGIVGMGRALELSIEAMPEETRRLTALRERLIEGLLARIPEIRVNGHREQRLPGNANVSIRYIEGEALLLRLDLAGIAASSGSACTSGSLDPSHVLLAIGLPHEIAHGSLRLTLGHHSTEADVDAVLETLPGIVDSLRSMSPLFAQQTQQASGV